MRNVLPLAFLPVVACLAACAIPTSTETTEETSSTSAAITYQSPADFTWSQGNAPTFMWPVSQGICVLTAVQGKFAGAGERVSVETWGTGAGATWVLTGSSGQRDVAGDAHCVSWHELNAPPPSSSLETIEAMHRIHCDTDWTVGAPLTICKDEGAMDKAFVSSGVGPAPLSGIGGLFDNQDTRVWVNAQNDLHARTTSQTQLTIGRATGIRLDTGLVGGRQSWPTYTTGQWRQENSQWTQLMPVNDGLCYLKSVAGSFKGAGERVQIVPINGYWWLGGHSGQIQVQATAECIAYEMRRGTARFESMVRGFVAVPFAAGWEYTGRFDRFGNPITRDLYLCYGVWGGGKHPGKAFAPNNCTIAYGGAEITVPPAQSFAYEGISADDPRVRWVQYDGTLPQDAFKAGYEADGRALFACRVNLGKTPGKIVDGTCHYSYAGRESATPSFEVLTITP